MTDRRKYADRAKYLRMAVSRRRKKLREMAIEYMGGQCQVCSYSKCLHALEFHHIDSNDKEFGLSSRGLTRSWLKIKIELDKCLLLCANCHRELHAGMLQPSEVIQKGKIG
ncbi:MAG: hypothetical protein ACOZAR_02715 [Patescibacteria group bacterium]